MFYATAMQIDNVNNAELLHAFVWGLKEREHTEVRLPNPKILDEPVCLALDFAELLHPNSCNLSHHRIVEGTEGQLSQGMETVHQYLWS